MSDCACEECNEQPADGKAFVQGHDSKLRARLEATVGGLIPLREFIKATIRFVDGEITAEEFHHLARTVIENGRLS